MINFKNLKNLFFLLVMGFSLSLVCACGDDKKDDPVLGLIGTWRYEFSSGYSYLYFDKTGFGWEHEYDEDDGEWYEKDRFVYVYDEAEKRIAIKWEDGDSEVIIILALSEDNLVLEDYGDSELNFYDRVSDGEYKTGDRDEDEGKDEGSDYTGSVNGHKYVDLGLSVKWATCNVGADSPEEYGDYYAWGETTTKSSYTESNSVIYDLSTSELKSRGIIGSDGNLTAAYDVAIVKWGSRWRMPTKEELEELKDDCTWEWTTQSGVKGCKVTGPNGNSIFLPAAGWRVGPSLSNAGGNGNYWTSTPLESGTQRAYYLFFYSSDQLVYWDYRSDGFSVRPVSE